MTRERAEPDYAVGVGLTRQLCQVADVDENLGRRQPHVETGEQALATGDRHGFAAGLRQYAISLLQRGGANIAEVTRFHAVRSSVPNVDCDIY